MNSIIGKIDSAYSKLRKHSLLWLTLRAFSSLSWLPIKLNIFYFFLFKGLPKSPLKHRFSGTIRWADKQDLPLIMECLDEDRYDLFGKRFDNKDRCIIAIDNNGNAAAFGWVSTHSIHKEDLSNCLISIPDGVVYIYNWYIVPQYRLTGLWTGFMQFVIDSEHYNPEKGIMSAISHGNDPSIRTHVRYGFKIYLRKIVLTVFSKPFSIDKDIAHNNENIKKTFN